MNATRLQAIIKKHQMWLRGYSLGERANFTGENLRGVKLNNLDLSKACFIRCDLAGADLSNSTFDQCNFSYANLLSTNVNGSTFENANFTNTTGVPISNNVVPANGEFIAYKKVAYTSTLKSWNESKCKNEYVTGTEYFIAKLRVPSDALRSNGSTETRYYNTYDTQNEYVTNSIQLTKVRVSKALVENIYTMNGKAVTDDRVYFSPLFKGTSIYDTNRDRYWSNISGIKHSLYKDYQSICKYVGLTKDSEACRIRLYFGTVTNLEDLDVTISSQYVYNNYRHNIFYNTQSKEGYYYNPKYFDWEIIDDSAVLSSLELLSSQSSYINDDKIIISFVSSIPTSANVGDMWLDKTAAVLYSSMNLCINTYTTTEYAKGNTVYADTWDPNPWNVCSNGIHCFLSFEQAKKFTFVDDQTDDYILDKIRKELQSLITNEIIDIPNVIKKINDSRTKCILLNYGYDIDFYELDTLVTTINQHIKYGIATRNDNSYDIKVNINDNGVDFTLFDLQKEITALVQNKNITKPDDVETSSSSDAQYIQLKYSNNITYETFINNTMIIQNMIKGITFVSQYDYSKKIIKLYLGTEIPDNNNEDDNNDNNDASLTNIIVFSDKGVTTKSPNISISGSVVTINASGEYKVKGTGEGNIIINAEEVILNLSKLNLTSTTSCIHSLHSTLLIKLDKDSTLTCAAIRPDEAAIKSDTGILSISGNGSLTIASSCNGFIANTLSIGDATYRPYILLNSDQCGLKAVHMNLNNGQMIANSKEDGLYLDNKSSLLKIKSGIWTITSNQNTINCDGDIQILGGETKLFATQSSILCNSECIYTNGILFALGNIPRNFDIDGNYVEFNNLNVSSESYILIKDDKKRDIYQISSQLSASSLIFACENNMRPSYTLYLDYVKITDKNTTNYVDYTKNIIEFTSSGINIDSEGVTARNSIATITKSGTYTAKGTGSGCIKISAQKVILRLDNLTLSYSGASPIQILSEKTSLVLVGKSSISNSFKDVNSGCISSAYDFNIVGDGSLNLVSASHAIYCDNSMSIGDGSESCTLSSISSSSGIVAKNFNIFSGLIDVTSATESINVSENITLQKGTLRVDADNCGLVASKVIKLNDGVIIIFSGNYYNNDPYQCESLKIDKAKLFILTNSQNSNLLKSLKRIDYFGVNAQKGSIVDLVDSNMNTFLSTTTTRKASRLLFSSSDLSGKCIIYVDDKKVATTSVIRS